jgi:Uma2 family endonuclease
MGRLMSSLGTKRLTFDEWQALPETTQICEVVDGVLVMPPTPLWEHQWLSMEIAVRLRNFVNERGMGLAITAPYDILIQREPLRTRQPDILVVNAALTGVTSPADLVGQPFLELPPLLVVEVLSPGNTRREIDERLADYRSIGVPECWLVNFPTRSVEVLRLTAEAATTTAIFGMGDTLSCEVLPGFTLPIADIFGPLLP